MPHTHEIALRYASRAYIKPTAITHYWDFYRKDRVVPWSIHPLPRNTRERPPLVITMRETFPPLEVFCFRICRHCLDAVEWDNQARTGRSRGSCYCKTCYALLKRANRLQARSEAIMRRTYGDAFWTLPKPERSALMREAAALERKAARLSRPHPPPARVLAVPAYWTAPALPLHDHRRATPLPRPIPPHIPGAPKQPPTFFFSPKSRPWKRFISRLKANAPRTYAPAENKSKNKSEKVLTNY